MWPYIVGESLHVLYMCYTQFNVALLHSLKISYLPKKATDVAKSATFPIPHLCIRASRGLCVYAYVCLFASTYALWMWRHSTSRSSASICPQSGPGLDWMGLGNVYKGSSVCVCWSVCVYLCICAYVCVT